MMIGLCRLRRVVVSASKIIKKTVGQDLQDLLDLQDMIKDRNPNPVHPVNPV